MNETIEIRPMRPGDADPVAGLVAQLGYQRTPEQVRAWISGLAARAQQAAFVALLSGEVVGWITVCLDHPLQSDSFGLIGGLVVKDGVRSLGIGHKLCQQAEQWTLQQGINKIRVTSRSTREAAHRFYLRDGYQQTKASMVFEKPLTP